jgi:hypothetical protein
VGISGAGAFVDLAPIREPSQVIPAIARVLGVRESGERSLLEAREYLLEAEVMASEVMAQSRHFALEVQFVRQGLADVALAAGNLDRAQEILYGSLRSLREPDPAGVRPHFSSSPLVAGALARLAQVAYAQDRFTRGVRLLGAATTLPHQSPPPPASPEGPERERLLAALRRALGDEAFDAAWDEGQAMTRDAAIACALEDTE